MLTLEDLPLSGKEKLLVKLDLLLLGRPGDTGSVFGRLCAGIESDVAFSSPLVVETLA